MVAGLIGGVLSWERSKIPNERIAMLFVALTTLAISFSTPDEWVDNRIDDVDREGEEGVFYVWKTNEINDLLGDNDAKLIIDYYNLNEKGNWPEGRRHGKTNILHINQDSSVVAKKYSKTSYGGTSEKNVKKMIKIYKRDLNV